MVLFLLLFRFVYLTLKLISYEGGYSFLRERLEANWLNEKRFEKVTSIQSSVFDLLSYVKPVQGKGLY